ncbi:hypothetical protein C8R43DRAFT_1143258 [Mycena crocata]|nr:hypothetical protein C8R43DRAFT_1143258 [Mycena crocata]
MNGLSAYLLQKITMFSNPVGLSPSALNSEIDEPWYATSFGLISHDKERLFESLDEVIENPPKGKSASDYPVFSASSFEGIVQYLPGCTSLKRCFQRDSKGRKRQHKIIYYVVDGDRTVFTDIDQAKQCYDQMGDPWAVISAHRYREIAEVRAAWPNDLD